MKNLIAVLTIAIALSSCGSNSSDTVSLVAAGATFPLPFYNLAIKNYSNSTGTQLTYGGIGSGGGIRSLRDKVVDFGATDAYLNTEQEENMPAELIHIPTCIGAVVIAYSLPGIEDLKLSNENLQDIFMGKITNWNDAKIKASNPGVILPDLDVTVVHRSDGSGTTYIFSDFMSKVSAEWDREVGRGKSLKWPVGLGAKGNPGVAGTIKQTAGAVGYIGSEFAFTQKIPVAQVENSAGNYVMPSLASISAAAKGDIPENTKVMLTCSSDPEAYPISGFTWLILYKDQAYDNRSEAQARETVKFISWIIEKDAQALAQQVNYAPLPGKTVAQARELLGSVVYKGQALNQ